MLLLDSNTLLQGRDLDKNRFLDHLVGARELKSRDAAPANMPPVGGTSLGGPELF